MADDDWIELDELRRRLGTTRATIDRWAHLAPTIDRAGGRVLRIEAVLIALPARLRQQGVAPGLVRTAVAQLLATVDDPSHGDWVVTTQRGKRVGVHVGEPVDLARGQLIGVVVAAEVRALLAG